MKKVSSLLIESMPNKWIEALKKFNEKNKTEWCIPRKGGKEYEEIKRIMNGETRIPKVETQIAIQSQVKPLIVKEPKVLKQKKQNSWITHVRRFAINRGITYIEALKQARATYNKEDYQ